MKPNKHQTESGAVLVVFATTLVVLLAVIGLAVDAGNLYRARLALQNSADAAALAGIAYTTSKGKFALDREVREFKRVPPDAIITDQDITEYLNSKAAHIARAVMARANFPHTDTSPVIVAGTYERPALEDASDVAAEYRVTLTRRIDFHLMNLLPGINAGEFMELSASATMERKAARISLFLDISDSMNCPADGSCDCMTVPGAGPCAGVRKIDDLIDAAKSFAKMFDPARDTLYLIPFNTRARAFTMEEYYQRLTGVLPAMDQLTEAHVDQLFDFLRTDAATTPHGSTNLCDALLRARAALEKDGVIGVEGNSFVIFSDGAPTAGRFLFADAKPALAQWDPNGWTTHDYNLYTVEWRQDDDPFTARYGPSILLQTDLLAMTHVSATPPPPGTGYSDDGSPSAAGWGACSVNTPDPLRAVTKTASQYAVANSVFSPCLNSLAAHLPGESGTVFGRNYGPSGSKTFGDWQEQYYNCAIQLTDQFRHEGGPVYVIGLGEGASFLGPSGEFISDPYQNVTASELRHDIFNSRLANDYIRAIEAPQVPEGVPKNPYPEWGYQGYTPYYELRDSKVRGSYLATPNTLELERLFEEIGQKILLRMIE